MREAERKRLVKLIQDSVDGCAENWARVIADYLIENGVIVPPCKVGDTVYVLGDEYFWEAEVVGWSYFVDKHTVLQNTLYYMLKGEERIHYFEVDDIGKTVFFSKAEAEYALKNRRSVSLVDGHIEE